MSPTSPSRSPTASPTSNPTTKAPTLTPTLAGQTWAPTAAPTTRAPTARPTKDYQGWTYMSSKHCFAHRLPSAAAPAKHATLAVAQSENNTRCWALAGHAKHFVLLGNSSLNAWSGTSMSKLQWNAHDEAPSSSEFKGAVPTPAILPGNFCASWITTIPFWNASPPAACQRFAPGKTVHVVCAPWRW